MREVPLEGLGMVRVAYQHACHVHVKNNPVGVTLEASRKRGRLWSTYLPSFLVVNESSPYATEHPVPRAKGLYTAVNILNTLSDIEILAGEL